MLPRYEKPVRLSRRWDEASWAASMATVRRRGWITDDNTPTLTEHGRQRRQWIEDQTNVLALPAFEPLGQDGVNRMTTLGTTLTHALFDAGMVPAHYRPAPRAE